MPRSYNVQQPLPGRWSKAGDFVSLCFYPIDIYNDNPSLWHIIKAVYQSFMLDRTKHSSPFTFEWKGKVTCPTQAPKLTSTHPSHLTNPRMFPPNRRPWLPAGLNSSSWMLRVHWVAYTWNFQNLVLMGFGGTFWPRIKEINVETYIIALNVYLTPSLCKLFEFLGSNCLISLPLKFSPTHTKIGR